MKRIPTHKKCKCKKFCSQTRLVGEIYSSDVIMHRGYRADFFGEGTSISGRLTNTFGSRFGTSTKLFRGVIGPISTPNDYLNAVFDDIISLCGSCRNNALPRPPREKLQLVAILLPACDGSFLTIKEYAICRSPHQTGTYSLAMDS